LIAIRRQAVEYFEESLCYGAPECVSARRDCLLVHVARRNRQVSSLFGYDCARPLDRPLREVIPAFDRDRFGFYEVSFQKIIQSCLGNCRCALSCVYALLCDPTSV